MSTENIQQSFLEAMQLLSSSAAGSTNASITIKGSIVELLDESTHLYSVSYGGAIYKDVYSMSNVVYTPSTVVYVLIPNKDDFSQPKFILGAVSPTASMYITEAEEDRYISINSNLFEGDNIGNIELKSPIDITEDIIVFNGDRKNAFKDYLNTYNHFLFSAYIKTNIDKEHQQIGNYGLKLVLPFIQKIDGLEITREYKMDVSTIPGNPYALTEFQKVDLYFEVEDTIEYDTTRNAILTYFVQGFEYYPIPEAELTPVDIWIKDINFQMVDVLTPENISGYYATISATEGNYFTASSYVNSKILTPLLKINGKESKLSGWDCYWFVEDSSITTSSEDYYSLGGLGWKCLNEKTNIEMNSEGRKIFQYVTNDYELEVSPNDVIAILRYKCILVKGDIVVQGYITLKNLSIEIETQLVSAIGSNTFIEDIGTARLIARIFYDGVTNNQSQDNIILSTLWQRFDKNNNYIDNNFYTIVRENDIVEINGKEYFETEITYPCRLIDKQNTIYCTFYKTEISENHIEEDENPIQVSNQYNLGTEHIVINTTKEYTYTISLSGGDVLYKYDSDGNSPLISNYDGHLSSKINTIMPIEFKVYKPDGMELTEDEYPYVKYTWSFPKNSMMQLIGYDPEELKELEQDDDYYYISGTGLEKSNINYSIARIYNKKKSNNTILLNIIFDNVSIGASANIKFLKDGESGTNGTKYSAIIQYKADKNNYYGYGERDAKGRVRKFQAVFYDSESEPKQWYKYNLDEDKLDDFIDTEYTPARYPEFKVVVYKDGELYTEGLSYVWSLFESSYNDSFDIVQDTLLQDIATLNINYQEDNQTPFWNEDGQIIQCAIQIDNIDDESSTNKETIYAYYPLEVTKVRTKEGLIPHLDGGYEEVIYASDGTNPQFDNSNAFYCTDSIYNNDEQSNYLTYNWNASTNFTISSIDGASAKISPKTSFQNGESKNIVKVTIGIEDEQYVEVGKNKQDTETAISQNNTKLDYYNYHNGDNDTEIRKQSNLYNLKNFIHETYTILDEQRPKLDTILNLLILRQKMLEDINELKQIVFNFYNYCCDRSVDASIYDYNTIQNNLVEKLSRAYKNLYLLGVSSNIEDISNNCSLSNIKIDVPENEQISDSIIHQIQIYANDWAALCQEYQKNYIEITFKISDENQYKYQEEYSILVKIIEKLFTIHIPPRLIDENNPEFEQFNKLNIEIEAILNNLKNYFTTLLFIGELSSGTLLGYSNYVEDLLDKLRNLLYNYNDEEQLKLFYDTKIEEINQQQEKLNKNLVAYNHYIEVRENLIIHVKPVIFLYNRYEFANLNGWDGNKLYIDKTNESYLLAPQIGAGIKNADNSFTGLLMGIRHLKNTSGVTKDIGLLGLKDGHQTIFLDAKTGKAEFGAGGEGQIILQPGNKAIIKSGNYNSDNVPRYDEVYWPSGNPKDNKYYIKSNNEYKEATETTVQPNTIYYVKAEKSGMMIDLTTPKIEFGSGNFKVSPEGYITAVGGGTIAGWKINDSQIYSDKDIENEGRITIDCGTKKIDTSVTPNRIYTAYGIYSHNHDELNKTNQGFYLSKEGLSIGNTIRIASEEGGSVKVGRLTGSKYWEINGDNSNSYIKYGTKGQNGSVYIGTNEIHLGSKLELKSDGSMSGGTDDNKKWEIKADGTATFKYLVAKKDGNIAGWTIEESQLKSSSGAMTIRAEGSLYGPGWWIKKDGNANFNNITCNGTWDFGTGNNTWNSTNGFSFGNGSLGGNLVNGNLAFTNGTVGLGTQGWEKQGLTVGTNGTSISGTVYASAGEISGSLIVHGTVVAGHIDCNGVIEAAEAKIETIITTYLTSKLANINSLTVNSITVNSGIYGTLYGSVLTAPGGSEKYRKVGESIPYSSISSRPISWQLTSGDVTGIGGDLIGHVKDLTITVTTSS